MYFSVSIILSLVGFVSTTDVIPKKLDPDEDSHYVGVVIALLTAIILLLVGAIMFMVARSKRSPRSDVLNSLQHNFNQDSLGLGIDKRGNHHMKVKKSIILYKRFFCLIVIYRAI